MYAARNYKLIDIIATISISVSVKDQNFRSDAH